MKRTLFVVLFIFIAFLFFEGISALGLIYLSRTKNLTYRPAFENHLTKTQIKNIQKLIDKKEKYITHHPTLGWSIKPNGSTDIYKANAKGIRANQNYTLDPPNNKVRIATFGDSYTHGDEVQNHETWQEHLNNIDPRLQTINFGVGGYGLDQAFLRYQQEGVAYRPDIVLIGFMSENPKRNANIFRPFYDPTTGLSLSKPRFKIHKDKLQLIENPLNTLTKYQQLLLDPKKFMLELSKDDFYVNFKYGRNTLDFFLTARLLKLLRLVYLKPKGGIMNGMVYNTDSEVYKVTVAVLEQFYQSIKNNDAVPIILIIPNSGDFWRMNEFKQKNYDPFLKYMDEQQMQYIDLTDPFLADPRNKDLAPLFAPGYHLSSLGNSRLAEYIYNYLEQNDLLNLIDR